jgi:hypothetical protein
MTRPSASSTYNSCATYDHVGTGAAVRTVHLAAPTADEDQASAGAQSAPTALLHRWKAAVPLPLSRSMQRDSGAQSDGAPWEIHAIAAPVLQADDAASALAVSLPAAEHATAASASLAPRASPASLPRSCALWTTTLQRQHPHLPRCPAPGQRPPSPPPPFSSFLFCLLISWTTPDLPNPSSRPPPTFLPVGPRPRSRTPMVRGRGRGPNRSQNPRVCRGFADPGCGFPIRGSVRGHVHIRIPPAGVRSLPPAELPAAVGESGERPIGGDVTLAQSRQHRVDDPRRRDVRAVRAPRIAGSSAPSAASGPQRASWFQYGSNLRGTSSS